ncbi:MAG: site-specific DNA-methyltransferase [Prevotella sp.]|nr:site-specific DNA-methyltransferase [Prevotella sp.]
MQIIDNIKFTFNTTYSTGNEECHNILIHGDNKDVLAELWPEYANRIRCIYIDPPYNNGETYHYYDDNNTQWDWLKDMRRVLNLLKPLLSKDGSIWISIDDSEMAYLRVEADKIFGRENFAGTIIWQQRKSRENRAVFSCNHEYILVYAKDLKTFKKKRNLLPVNEDFIKSKYKNPDNDPRGPWQSVTANVQSGHAVPSQFYTVVSPTGVRHDPPKGRCWIYNEERMKREIAEGNIWFGKDGSNTPRVKKYLRDAKIGLTPETIWLADEVGTSDSAKKQLMTLFPDKENIFETPKPEELLKRIIEIASDEDDYVLDCFIGSGTTIATAHKLNRHYIGIEIGNQMSELVVKRMNKVIEGETSGISKLVGWHGGGDFIFYNFDKKAAQIKVESDIQQITQIEQIERPKKVTVHYQQLDFFDVLQSYPEHIVENDVAHEDFAEYNLEDEPHGYIVKADKNVLVSLVKPDNVERYLDQSAKIYYTGKKFPSTVALNKLYYFMPYIKNKGVRDLYLIKIARVGSRKEGQPDNDPNDLRLVFEIEFLKTLFNDYKPVELEIWHTFTDTTMKEILDKYMK